MASDSRRTQTTRYFLLSPRILQPPLVVLIRTRLCGTGWLRPERILLRQRNVRNSGIMRNSLFSPVITKRTNDTFETKNVRKYFSFKKFQSEFNSAYTVVRKLKFTSNKRLIEEFSRVSSSFSFFAAQPSKVQYFKIHQNRLLLAFRAKRL